MSSPRRLRSEAGKAEAESALRVPHVPLGHAPTRGAPRNSRSLEEPDCGRPEPPLRPILAKSRSVDSSPVCRAQQRRSVSFQLPEESDTARSRMAALARSLKRLTLAGAAAGAGAARTKPEKAPKRILRQPVVHVYLRGASGLPTQRVPLSSVYRVPRDFRMSSVS